MKIHIVKKGDSMYSIAQKYHVSLEQLIAFNPKIEDPERIDVGMKVKIPMAPKPVEPPAGEYAHKHIIQQGDTLWKLSKAWEIPLQALIQANPQLKNPNVLLTGEVVYIPKLDKVDEHPAQPVPPMTVPPVGQQFAAQAIEPPAVIPTADGAEMPQMPQMPQMQSMQPMQPMQPMQSMQPIQPMQPMQPMPQMQSMQPMQNEPMQPMSQMQPMQSLPQMQHMMSEMSMHQMPSVMPQIPEFHIPAAGAGAEISFSELDISAGPEAQQDIHHAMHAEMPAVELDQPYQQAVHPFQQFHVTATEVFAHSPEPQAYTPIPSFNAMPQHAWGAQHEQGIQDAVYNASQGALPYSQPGYSDGGCGCGGSGSTAVQAADWLQYQTAYQPSYPQGTPLYGHDMHNGGYMPYTGMQPGGFAYPQPYEAPMIPNPDGIGLEQQANINNTDEEQQEVVVAVQPRNASKKSKNSRSAALKAYIKRQQARSSRPVKRQNSPWINV